MIRRKSGIDNQVVNQALCYVSTGADELSE